MDSLCSSRKRSSNDANPSDGIKRPKLESSEKESAVKRSSTFLEKIRHIRRAFIHKNGLMTGHCIVCDADLSLTWIEWKRHLLNHTMEREFYCFDCNSQLSNTSNHDGCSIENSVINIFSEQENDILDGSICKLCDYLQINESQLVNHLAIKHDNPYFNDVVERITLVPDMRPQFHIINTNFQFVPLDKRFQCGAGNCKFHGRTSGEFVDHFRKAHSIIKTFYCPHCKKIINRMDQPTVPVEIVLRHIECHDCDVYRCANDDCEFTTPFEAEIRAHGLNEHSEVSLKYWRNERTENCVTKVDLIKILFNCDICEKRLDTISLACGHFENDHFGYEIDLSATTEIKTTLRDQTVVWSKIDSTFHYRQTYTCGLCNEYFADKHNWLNHFLECHPTQPLAVSREFKWLDASKCPKLNYSNFDKNMFFFCAFCEDKNGHKIKCSSKIEGVYDHWKKIHMQTDLKPFRFCLAELIACYHCGLMSTFQGLQEHTKEAHPKQPFIPVKMFGKMKYCALCDYDGDKFIEHFETEHSFAMQANVFNPIRINERILWKLQQIHIHRKIKCDFCHEIFETLDDFHCHHADQHPKLERMARAIFDKESVKLIGNCCRAQVDPNTFFDHLAYDKHTHNCDKCPFTSTDGFTYISHLVEVHQVPGRISILYRNFMKLRYWRSELVFGNGLMVNRFNTEGTTLDYTKKFDEFVDRLVTEKKKEYTTARIIQ